MPTILPLNPAHATDEKNASDVIQCKEDKYITNISYATFFFFKENICCNGNSHKMHCFEATDNGRAFPLCKWLPTSLREGSTRASANLNVGLKKELLLSALLTVADLSINMFKRLQW